MAKRLGEENLSRLKLARNFFKAKPFGPDMFTSELLAKMNFFGLTPASWLRAMERQGHLCKSSLGQYNFPKEVAVEVFVLPEKIILSPKELILFRWLEAHSKDMEEKGRAHLKHRIPCLKAPASTREVLDFFDSMERFGIVQFFARGIYGSIYILNVERYEKAKQLIQESP